MQTKITDALVALSMTERKAEDILADLKNAGKKYPKNQ